MLRFHTEQIDASEFGVDGYYCVKSQYQYVLPRTERFVDQSRGLFVLGYAGADGIEFVLKPNDDCVYAYYPNVGEMHRLAPDFATFMAGWISNSIAL